MTFDNTEDEYISRRIEQKVQQPRIAFVQSVTEHTDPDDNSNFECNVITRGDRQELRNVPVGMPGKDMIHVPQKDDAVIVVSFGGRGEQNAILQTLHTVSERAPLGKAGDIKYQRGSLFFEIDGDGRYIRLYNQEKDEDPISTADAFLEVKDTIAGTVININSDSNISVKSESTINIQSSDVTLGSSDGEQKKVARKGDSVSCPNGSGTISSGSSDVSST
jgi:hypothetical protein